MDKYDDGATEAFSTTTKMAFADVERSVESAIETVLNKLVGIVTLKEEQTTALVAFVEKIKKTLSPNAASPALLF